jgi:beta-N-acetylhexosaminidase
MTARPAPVAVTGKHSIRQAAGSVLVVGLSGSELSGLEKSWLKLVRPAGIILFRRNIVDAKQSRALLRGAAPLCVEACLRCVDMEGGTVDRLRDAVAPISSVQAVSATRDTRLMRKHGELIAREILAFGFNTSLAPVLDLAIPISASVLGSRTASSSAGAVAHYAKSFMEGLGVHGVIGCGKHFPGLGGGNLDSHLETPAIQRTWSQMWSADLVPYRELSSELPMVMVSHATFPKTESKKLPATVSPFWVTDILKKRIGYRGLIFSDDLEMGGILKFMPIEEAVVAAMLAGLHLLEICHSPELILRSYEALIHEAEVSTVFKRLLLKRADETGRLRQGRFEKPMPRALSDRGLLSLKDEVVRFNAQVERANKHA